VLRVAEPALGQSQIEAGSPVPIGPDIQSSPAENVPRSSELRFDSGVMNRRHVRPIRAVGIEVILRGRARVGHVLLSHRVVRVVPGGHRWFIKEADRDLVHRGGPSTSTIAHASGVTGSGSSPSSALVQTWRQYGNQSNERRCLASDRAGQGATPSSVITSQARLSVLRARER